MQTILEIIAGAYLAWFWYSESTYADNTAFTGALGAALLFWVLFIGYYPLGVVMVIAVMITRWEFS